MTLNKAWIGPAAPLALGMALVLAGCGRGGDLTAAAGSAPADAPDPGYRGAPQLTGVVRGADGTVALSGKAMPSSQVRLASPLGEALQTTADGSGAWRAGLGTVSEPALYGLSAQSGDRKVQAEGYVAVLPGAPGAALLRAGAGAQVESRASAVPVIQAVDFDSGGAAVVSGRAPAGSALRLAIDGQLMMEGAAGADGRFSLTLPKPLAVGSRRLQVMTSKAMAAATVQVSPPRAPAQGPYEATAEAGGWRIDWLTPGGGPQTTLLLGDAGTAG